MKIEILRSYSLYNLRQAEGKFMKCPYPVIGIDEADYATLAGDTSVGKLVHILTQGRMGKIREYFDFLRLRKAERMVLRICANEKVSMSEVDEVIKIISPYSYDCVFGVATFNDVFPHEFIIDLFLKYEPAGKLRL